MRGQFYRTEGGKKLGKYKDLTGYKIGLLTVITNTGQKSKNGSFIWECLCDCGKTIYVPTSSLTRKRCTKSCGCLSSVQSKKKNTKDVTGDVYGMLTVIKQVVKPSYRVGKRGSWWLCRCECGNEVVVKANHLKTGNTKSCGCIINSKTEKQIVSLLQNYHIEYIKEYVIDDCRSSLTNRPLRFDFAIFDGSHNLLFLLEYDGEQHTSGFRYEADLVKRAGENACLQQRDRDKDNYCKQNNIKLYRLSYKQKDALEDIILKIYEEEKKI